MLNYPQAKLTKPEILKLDIYIYINVNMPTEQFSHLNSHEK